jgi:hypothetical protein
MEGGNSDILGKRVFFLHPSTVIQNHVASELIQQEYEVYIVKDHSALKQMLRRYPNSVVFVDIDEHIPEREWETWIREVMNDPGTNTTAIGIISAHDNDTLRRKYINSVRVRCGYTVLKSDLDNAIRQICEILKVMDARGRRKYLRAVTETETSTTINLPINGTFINGVIKDISVVGLSCAFQPDPELSKNTLFKDVQVKLQSALLKAEGIIVGSRIDGPTKTYVLLFTQRVDPEVRMKIRKYIQHNLQNKLDSELKDNDKL